jgi:transposase
MKTKKSNNESQNRRKYDEDFKSSAIKMVEEGRSVSDVSRALGITENMLYRWKSTAGKTTGTAGETQTELERLRRQLRQVEQERDILKKALSIFSRTT